jgi:hypothetical protein
LIDVEVFKDPFDEYKQRLEKKLKRQREDGEGLLGGGKKAKGNEGDRRK